MITSLLRYALCGCAHLRTTFPQTSNQHAGRTYVVCLDCGTEFDYNWQTMQTGGPVRASHRPQRPQREGVSLLRTLLGRS